SGAAHAGVGGDVRHEAVERHGGTGLLARYLPENLTLAHDAYTYDGYGPTTSHRIAGGDRLGRVRSVQTMWGNPEAGELAGRAVPWRGYHYDLEGRLTTAFEHSGLVEPVEPSSLAGRSIGHDDHDDLEDLNPGGQHLAAITDHRNSVVGWWNIDTGQMEHVIEYT